jgi:phage-related protein
MFRSKAASIGTRNIGTRKQMSGFGGAGVVEIAKDHRGDTFRAVYTLRYQGAVYVLHAFQKKSKTGRETPRRDMDLIKQRLREAERIARGEKP